MKIQISKLDKTLETTNSRLEESNQTQERIKAENQVLQSEIQEKEDQSRDEITNVRKDLKD